jgi:tRNA/tmRNA/rRNA uracil-C5-methylase (TrmA/RlmC/RlmD family)
VAHAGGLTLFVPGTVPGDVVEVEPTASEGRRRWQVLPARRLVQRSPHRVVPPCPYACDPPENVAASCGGCPWMNLSLAQQRIQKLAIVARAFSSAKNPVKTPTVVGTAGPDLGYRCRTRMNTAGGRLGFFAPLSHRIVDVTACLMVPHTELHSRLRPFFAEPSRSQGGSVELRLLYGDEGRLHLTVDQPLAVDFAAMRDAVPGLAGVRVAGREYGLDGLPVDTPGFGPITVSSAGFFQAGPFANGLILRELERILSGLDEPGPVLECYAGSGNLTRVLRRYADVVAVESDPQSARFFGRNLADHPGPGEATLLSMSVEEAVRARKITFSPRTIVLDPPREGIDKSTNDALVRLAPRFVVLISCDPMNGARDASEWLRAGYERHEFLVMDTMPHTQHFEIIQVFQK